jgi:23S rRNA pseudouridine2605 synthase
LKKFRQTGKQRKFADRAGVASTSGRKVGLARALSKLGFCSRARATVLIRGGRLHVNGAVRRNPETPVHVGLDRVEVDGRVVVAMEKLYFAFHKPRGIVTSASDEQGRATIYDFLKMEPQWIAPVGRLDKASEGLLLLTNDSEWGARILAPETHVEKIYHVQIGGRATPELLEALRRGVPADGDTLRVKRVEIVREGGRSCWLEMVLDEGKNRQIRRMLAGLRMEVLRLFRIAVGPILLGELGKGEYRALTGAEMTSLEGATGLHSERSRQTTGRNKHEIRDSEAPSWAGWPPRDSLRY